MRYEAKGIEEEGGMGGNKEGLAPRIPNSNKNGIDGGVDDMIEYF
jgi:hypothetical protein